MMDMESLKMPGSEIDSNDGHREFVKNSKLLIETTTQKLNVMQVLSDDLSELASRIKDDREEKKNGGKYKPKQGKPTKETKQNYDVVIPIAPYRETPSPDHQQNQSPRPKKSKKTSVKDKDINKVSKNKNEVKTTVVTMKETTMEMPSHTNGSVKGKKSTKGKTSHTHEKRHKKGKKASTSTKTGKEDKNHTTSHTIQSKAEGEKVFPTKGGTSFTAHTRPSPKKHCCDYHGRLFNGPVIFEDSHEQFKHIQLPALLRATTLLSSRQMCEVDNTFAKSDTYGHEKCESVGQEIYSSLSYEQTSVKSGKVGCNKFRNTCLQETDRKSSQQSGKRDILTPNKVTIQSTGFTRMFTETSFLPLDEISVKFRFRFGRSKPIFPLNLNLDKYFCNKNRYSYGYSKIGGSDSVKPGTL